MKTAEEIINKEIDFTNDRLKNAPFVITKLECKLLMESFSKSQNKELIESLEKIKLIKGVGSIHDIDRLNRVNWIARKALKTKRNES